MSVPDGGPAARAQQVDAHLRAALSLPDDDGGWPDGVDMSPEAVTSRLMEAFEMTALCLELQHAAEALDRSGT